MPDNRPNATSRAENRRQDPGDARGGRDRGRTGDRHRRSCAPRPGYVTLDPAYMNTALDDERDHLPRRREGHPALPRHPDRAAGREVDLRRGRLPAHLRPPAQQDASSPSSPTLLTRHSMIHEDMKRFFDGYPATAHPMAILSAMVLSLSSFYPRGARREEPRASIDSDHRAPARRRCGPSRPSRTRSRSASRSSTRRTTSATARTSST